MNEDEMLLKLLKKKLADELSAVNQYTENSDMLNNRVYGSLIKTLEKHALDELHYASWLIQRIVFNDGIPAISKLGTIKLCDTDLDIIKNIRTREMKELLAHCPNIDPNP